MRKVAGVNMNCKELGLSKCFLCHYLPENEGCDVNIFMRRLNRDIDHIYNKDINQYIKHFILEFKEHMWTDLELKWLSVIIKRCHSEHVEYLNKLLVLL
jgi:hypothetical protein